MRMAVVRLFCLLLVVGTLAHAEAHKDKVHKAKKNYDLADAVYNNVILSKFAALVQASDMGTFLSSRGPFTLFAPTNSASCRSGLPTPDYPASGMPRKPSPTPATVSPN